MDQEKFLEMVEEIRTIASAQQNKMTKEEVRKYLSDMGLGEDKMEAVYQYLAVSGVQIEGYHLKVDHSKNTENAEDKEGTKEVQKVENSCQNTKETGEGFVPKEKKESRAKENLKYYKMEVSKLNDVMLENEKVLFTRFFQGDEMAKKQIIHGKLQHVIDLASQYENRGISVDEIIEEGNLGLMEGMSVLAENKNRYFANETPDMEAILGTLDMEIKHQMEQMLDSQMQQKDWEDTVLAKTNLLHEAAKYLADEMGRAATREELSTYTKISEEEISEIMGLSEDAKKVMNPE